MKMLRNNVLIKKGTDENNNLFLIHAGNGEIQNYIKFCNFISSSFTCWGLRANRFNNLHPINESIEEVAKRYIDIIRSIQPNGPYNIIGWCFGGIRAFEIVAQLESIGERVNFLGLINTHAPFRIDKQRENMVRNYSLLDYRPECKMAFTHKSEEKLIKKWLSKSNFESIGCVDPHNIWLEFVDNYKESEKVDVIMDAIKHDLPEDRKAAIPFYEKIDLEKLIYYLAVMRSDANAQAYYIPKTKVDAPTYYFSAIDSLVVDRFEWNNYTKRSIGFSEIRGNHFSIFDSENVKKLAKSFEDFYFKKEELRL